MLTGEKSVVKLKFADKSTMNLGPKSKVVISKMPKKKSNMVHFLTGVIKSEVKKESKKESKNKLIIKTRTAVMGVRGTKFQTIYNAQNKTTSLVTVEGKVATVKRESVVVEKVAQNSVDQTVANGVRASSKEVLTTQDELDQLDRVLETSKDVVEVSEGKFAGVAGEKTAPTKPVKIAPAQYDALAKSMDSTKTAAQVMKVTPEDEVISLDKKAPKSGGFIDFQTGLYVAPPEGSQFDEKTGTFKADKIGEVDQETGDYIPPKGVKLDAKKGFVIDEEEIAKVATKDKNNIKVLIGSLNDEVKKVNKVVAKEQKKQDATYPASHKVYAQIIPYSEMLTFKQLNSNQESVLYSEQATRYLFAWQRDWSDKWQSYVQLLFQTYELARVSGKRIDQEDEADSMFRVGAIYSYSPNFKLRAAIHDEALVFGYTAFRQGGEEVIIQQSTNLTSLTLGANYLHLDRDRWSTYIDVELNLYGDQQINIENFSQRTQEVSGFKASYQVSYLQTSKLTLGGETFFSELKAKTSDFSIERLSFGLVFNAMYSL